MPRKNRKSKHLITNKNILLHIKEKPGQILSLVPDINQIFPDGRTLLTMAIENFEALSLVESIVISGADVNVQNQQGQTALMIAARVQRNDVIQYLINSGSELDVLNNKHVTALAICTVYNNTAGVELLIESGADFNIKTGKYKETALELATRLKHEHIKDVLLKFTPVGCEHDKWESSVVNTESDKCKTHKPCLTTVGRLIHTLPQKENFEEVKTIFSQMSKAHQIGNEIGFKTMKLFADTLHSKNAINVQDASGRTVSMYAAMRSSSKTIDYILKFNPDVNMQDIDGKTVLMYVFCSKLRLKVSTVYKLLGHRPYIQDKFGKTALMYAIENNFQLPPEMVKLLLGDAFLVHNSRHYFLYCDTSILNKPMVIADNEGRTHLMYAIEKKPNLSIDEIKLLLGDTVNCQDKQGRTALMYALNYIPNCSTDIALSLKGKNLHIKSLMLAVAKIPELSSATLKALIGDQINVQDKRGYTPLMHAVNNNSERIIKLLLKWGADSNIQDHEGKTVFMMALVKAGDSRDQSDHLYFYERDLQNVIAENTVKVSEPTLIRLLGNKINLTDKQGWTALVYAVKYFQSNNLIQHIVKSGADVNIKHESGQTVLMTLLAASERTCTLSTRGFFFDLFYSYQNRTCEDILDALQYLQNPELSEENRIYLSQYLKNHSRVNFNWACTNKKTQLRWLLINGILLKQINVRESKFQDNSPLLVALELDQLDVAKYLIVNYCLTGKDLFFLREYYKIPPAANPFEYFLIISMTHERYQLKISKENIEFVKCLTASPWPLVKLALITVSSAVGFHDKRQSYISRLPIPELMKNYLKFQSPEANLPVDQWSDISLF